MNIFMETRSGYSRSWGHSCVRFHPSYPLFKMRRLYFQCTSEFAQRLYSIHVFLQPSLEIQGIPMSTTPQVVKPPFQLYTTDTNSPSSGTSEVSFWTSPHHPAQEYECFLGVDPQSGNFAEYNLVIAVAYQPSYSYNLTVQHAEYTITSLRMSTDHKCETTQRTKKYFERKASYLRFDGERCFCPVDSEWAEERVDP